MADDLTVVETDQWLNEAVVGQLGQIARTFIATILVAISVGLVTGAPAGSVGSRTQFKGTYSSGFVPVTASGRCASMPVPTALPSGVSLRLQLRETVLRPGGWEFATLVVENSGPKPFNVDAGLPLVAQIVRPGTRTVIGTTAFGIGGDAAGVGASAGDTQVFPDAVGIGTTRCDGGRGAMPPGKYEVLTYLTPARPGPNSGGPFYYTSPLPIWIKR